MARQAKLLQWRAAVKRSFPLLAPGEKLREDGACGCALEVKLSSIPGAGCGLFARMGVVAGSAVCVYSGSLLRTSQAFRLQKEDRSYLMRLGNGRWVDAGPHKHVFARYVNDARRPGRYNVYFDKRPELGFAVLVALRDIAAGEEIFASYGKWYWSKRADGGKAPLTQGTRTARKPQPAESGVP